MKKKSIIIPVICMVLSLAAMLTMTVFATPVIYMYSVSKNTIALETDELAVFKETHKVMETVIKLDPNSSNLYWAAWCFRPARIGDSEYLEICPDYEKKSLEYAERFVEAVKTDGNRETYYSMTTDVHEYQVAAATADYVTALWYADKKDEAKKAFEDYIHTLTKDNTSCAIAFNMEGTLFLISTTGNDADREWLNNLESHIIELHNNSIEYKRSTGNYYPVEMNRWEIGENGRIEQIYEEAEE